jgi:hypothetical protein
MRETGNDQTGENEAFDVKGVKIILYPDMSTRNMFMINKTHSKERYTRDLNGKSDTGSSCAFLVARIHSWMRPMAAHAMKAAAPNIARRYVNSTPEPLEILSRAMRQKRLMKRIELTGTPGTVGLPRNEGARQALAEHR